MDISRIENLNLVLMYEASTANKSLNEKLKLEIIHRNKTNKRFSLEYFYSVCVVGKKVVTVHFFPFSESFKKFGPTITGEAIFNNIEEIKLNYQSSPPKRTFGFQKLKIFITENLSQTQKMLLSVDGFDVKDVMHATFE